MEPESSLPYSQAPAATVMTTQGYFFFTSDLLIETRCRRRKAMYLVTFHCLGSSQCLQQSPWNPAAVNMTVIYKIYIACNLVSLIHIRFECTAFPLLYRTVPTKKRGVYRIVGEASVLHNDVVPYAVLSAVMSQLLHLRDLPWICCCQDCVLALEAD